MKCLLYARVSTDGQADRELSIPAQLAAMRQFASDRDWEIESEFLEAGASGRTADRPALRAMLARCRQEADPVQFVLVHKVDRLTRKLSDHLAIKTLLKERGITLASVVENLDESNSGQLVEHIMASLAEFYSANLSEEVKKGMRQKVIQGGWPHKPPRGYRLVTVPSSPTRVVVPDPVEGSIIRWAFETISQHPVSLRRLGVMLASRGLTQKNGQPISVETISRILRNPFYIGMVRWAGQSYKGIHEPLVSDALFYQVQSLMRSRTKKFDRRSHPEAILDRFALCAGCGRPVTVSATRSLLYYHCVPNRRAPCKQSYVQIGRIHEELEVVYQRVPLSPTGRRVITSALARANVIDQQQTQRRRRLLQEQLRSLHQRQLIVTDRFGVGLVDKDAFDVALAAIDSERTRLEMQLHRTGAASTEVSVNEARTLGDVHRRLPPTLQRVLSQAVLTTASIGPHGVTEYEFKDAFAEMS
jgi:DNA invertase Pin-like site-specific DNA recombinase